MFFLTQLNPLFKPWGILGSLFAGLTIILSGLFYYLGSKMKNDKLLNKAILLFGLIFIAMEIIHEVRRYIELGGYDYSSFPFQISSVSMYLCIIIQFFNKGRIRSAILSFMSLFTVLSGFLPIFFAQGNLFRWNSYIGIMFSFSWHTLLAMLGMMVLGYRQMGASFKVDKGRILEAITVFLIMTCIAQLLNFLLHTLNNPWPMPEIGYKEAGYMPGYELDPDSASLFYISPYFKSNIGIGLSNIWLKGGFISAWAAYALSFITLASVVYITSYSIKRLPKALANRGLIIFNRKYKETDF